MAGRAVSNLLGLAVLSVLAQRPMHRYEIATTIREQGKDRDMAVKWGSLYTVVAAMERHGFVEATGVDRAGARPERTTYRITPAGRHEMAEWTRELVANLDASQSRFAVGLSMLGALTPPEAITLLRDRLHRLETRIDEQRANLDRWSGQVARLFLVEDEYGLRLLVAESEWLHALLGELESGTFAGMDDWRAYHRAAPDLEEAPTTDR